LTLCVFKSFFSFMIFRSSALEQNTGE